MKTLLVTGGAGFIGVNAALRFARAGWKVAVLDDLSRKGSEENLSWLRSEAEIEFVRADIRGAEAVEAIVAARRPKAIIHLAGQVAVTTSVVDPRTDFEINALGTFNLLEAVRRTSPESIVLNASTNKVYGNLEGVEVELRGGRWELCNLPNGVSERQFLDFHSPYGCSKGVADQYAIDYGRIYGLRTFTLRQSCIYGTRQMGVEDQGWVAWFVIAAILGRPFSIYGDGRQIRDLLWIDDLIDLYAAAIESVGRGELTGGCALNAGGGPPNTLSLLELVAKLETITGRELEPRFEPWRPGDQKVFVSDVREAERRLGWRPRTSVDEGIDRLARWVESERALFEQLFPFRL